MPRIAVAIFVVVAVSVSIGINIARYPAVFEMAGSTHESLVSDDTTEVSETKETEGTVAVNTMPALPDKDLEKWNPLMVSSVKPTLTEAVPRVASNHAYGEDTYAEESDVSSEQEPEATVVTEEVSGEENSTPELNQYEVEPYRPYTSQPVEERAEDRGQKIEEREQKEEAPAERPETAYEDPDHEDSSDYESYPAEDNTGGGDTYQPNYRDQTYYKAPSSDALTWQNPVEISNPNPNHSNVMPEHSAEPANEMQSVGHWAATVAEVFCYNPELADASGKSSFYDKSPDDGYERQATVQEVSSTKSVPATSLSNRDAPEVKNPLRQDDSMEICKEKIEWEATIPMVAVHARQPMNEDLPRTQIKRLPSIKGTEVLPGVLPSPETMDYPVAK